MEKVILNYTVKLQTVRELVIAFILLCNSISHNCEYQLAN